LFKLELCIPKFHAAASYQGTGFSRAVKVEKDPASAAAQEPKAKSY
jgi:hypothetical protein